MNITEELFSIPRIAALVKRDRRWCERQLANVASVRKGNASFYKLTDALPALLADSESLEIERRILADRQREQKHLADLREIELAERVREVVLLKDVQGLWKDGFAKISGVIRAARYLTNEQKNRSSMKSAP